MCNPPEAQANGRIPSEEQALSPKILFLWWERRAAERKNLVGGEVGEEERPRRAQSQKPNAPGWPEEALREPG